MRAGLPRRCAPLLTLAWLAVALAAGPAPAQFQPAAPEAIARPSAAPPAAAAPPQGGSVTECVAAADAPLECLGAQTQACVGRLRAETTPAIVECIQSETRDWDAMLNREYKATMAAMRAEDATGDLLDPAKTRADALRNAQRAWIAFRDAECGLQAIRWGRDALRAVAAANCLMEETAERALELRGMRGQ
jgi:uncharacterized protein YecT (DUF1311 family)